MVCAKTDQLVATDRHGRRPRRADLRRVQQCAFV